MVVGINHYRDSSYAWLYLAGIQENGHGRDFSSSADYSLCRDAQMVPE
jgi:hypothetical protein